MPHICIFYHSTDDPGAVERLGDELRGLGFDVLMDNRSVLNTMTPKQTEAIRDAKALIVLMGPDWLGQVSDDDFLQSTLEDALKRKTWVIPMFVGGADILHVMNLPPRLRGFP